LLNSTGNSTGNSVFKLLLRVLISVSSYPLLFLMKYVLGMPRRLILALLAIAILKPAIDIYLL